MSKNRLIVNDHFSPIILKNVLTRHWYKPILLIAIMTLMAFLYLRYTKPIYNSQAVLQIVRSNKVKQVLGEQSSVVQDESISKDVELLRSPVLFHLAVQNLNINTSVFNEGDLLTENLYGNTPFSILVYQLNDSSLCGNRIKISSQEGLDFQLDYVHNNRTYQYKGQLGKLIRTRHFSITLNSNNSSAFQKLIDNGEIYFIFNKHQNVVKELRQGLSITPIDEGAKTIEISFSHENAKLCFDLVQSIINSYFNYEKLKKQEENIQTISFIDGQLDSLAMVLDHSKDSLTQYQRNTNLPNPDYEETDITSNLAAYSKKVSELNEELSAVNYVNGRISSDVSRNEIYRILPELVGRKSFEGSITRQIEELNKLLETKEDLLQDVTNESSKIRLVNERINNRIQGVKKSLGAIQDRLKHEKRLMELEMGKYEARLLGLPEKTTEYNRLKYMEELNREYFNLFTQKKIQFQLNNAGYSSENRLLSLPELSSEPLSPNRDRTYLIIGSLGILLGLAWLVFYYLTYNEITTLSDLKNLLPESTTILGSVPLYNSKMQYSQIVVNAAPKSRMAESIRNIKSNMNFINKDAKLIAVSSSISGEGKTFVILNIAATFAGSGKRCIVLDLDLRKPKVHHGFQVENENGMSQILSDLLPLEEAICHSKFPNLDFITAGPVPPNPSDLIQSQTLELVLEKLKSTYDIILIDNPPVGIVSDGINLLTQADIPIYVFKSNYSKRVFADQLMNLFEIQKLEKINVILNAVPNQESWYGYGYGFGYGYGYGYGYGGYYSDDKKSPWWRRLFKRSRRRK